MIIALGNPQFQFDVPFLGEITASNNSLTDPRCFEFPQFTLNASGAENQTYTY
jgi:hypothetical protein